MAHRTTKNLLSKLTKAPGAGSQQICMPQDTLYVLDSALVTIEDNARIKALIPAARDPKIHYAVGCCQSSQIIAVAVAKPIWRPLVPAGLQISIHLQLQEFFGQFDN